MTSISLPFRQLFHQDRHIMRFSRYLAVGGVMFFINILLIWMFVEGGHMNYLIAASLAFIPETLAGFYINRHWTFKTNTWFRTGFFRFLTIGLYSFLFVLVLTYGFIHFFAFHYVWARMVSTMISGFIGYFLDLKITFRV